METTHMTTATPDIDSVLGTEHECLVKLAPLWTAADVLPFYPASTETVVEVMRVGGGYDVTAELLSAQARSGMIPDVRIKQGRLAWSPQNILTAIVQADTWRRWIALDPRHIHKLSAPEIAEAMANATGDTIFTDADNFDTNAFIEMLVNLNDPQMRRTFATALKTRLRKLGALDK